jgi:hypothetical protein
MSIFVVQKNINMSKKTLVIHPDDRSTDFLKDIYVGKGWDVINEPIKRRQLVNRIKEYDRIIMLGHGSPNGLFNIDATVRYNSPIYLIDSDLVWLLSQKECIGVWCHANAFFDRYGLGPFATGMVISEVGEAKYYNKIVTQDEVDNSNMLIAKAFKECIDTPGFPHNLTDIYNGEGEVIKYNTEKLELDTY